jgi:hypothetical protein
MSYKARDYCSKCGKHGSENKLCSACHISAYCCKECQSSGERFVRSEGEKHPGQLNICNSDGLVDVATAVLGRQ